MQPEPEVPADHRDADELAPDAVALVRRWVVEARRHTGRRQARREHALAALLDDPDGLRFAMAFIDRVLRATTTASAADQLHALVAHDVPGFLGPLDRLALRVGAELAPRAPALVMPLAERRVRMLTDHLVIEADDPALARHLRRKPAGVRANLNRLGEAILGEEEAERRLDAAIALLARPDADYVSVKVSAVASRLNLWSFDETVARVGERLLRLYRAAATRRPRGFVNLDMEEYRDLDLTIAVFRRMLDREELGRVDAGIVLQAYVPDSFGRLVELVHWAGDRHRRSGGTIKVRIVKGANLAMERVDAEVHGWPQAPYASKDDVDANWKRMIDWAFRPERLTATRIGVASHNLFDVAWAHLLAERRAVADRVDFEMLEGMAPAQAELVRAATGGMLLYTPIVAESDRQSAIAYLFRRLEENAGPENFLRHLLDLEPGSPAFVAQRDRFLASLAARWTVPVAARRTQDRRAAPPRFDPDAPFDNEPDTDPALAANRRWAADVVANWRGPTLAPLADDRATVDRVLARAREAAPRWAATSADERRATLERVAHAIAVRRGEIVGAMVHEAGKVVAEADAEVSEAVDFARYYARRAGALDAVDGAAFTPLGVVCVAPPWNFPFAIPAGGVLAALAAGNAVVLKPSLETPAVTSLVAECCDDAGLPDGVVTLVRTRDDDVGRHLITHDDVDAVILTGAFDTARLFRSWKPTLRLFAETSGKNAMIISDRADVDAAVADLVRSAFGHAGQKCSAASLAIVEAGVYDGAAFRRQLRDAVLSLRVGDATDLRSDVGPLIHTPDGPLARAFEQLEPGEEWLVEPTPLDDGRRLWRPGVKLGVRPGSWFHHTECFGPVLGVLRADDLTQALQWQNEVAYGLTGGLWSLDADEVDWWLDRVEVGNAYVNRPTTGAIVRRQPFGGWKHSVVGPGAKAGGPNYVAQLGHWRDRGTLWRTESPAPEVRRLLDRARPHLDGEAAGWVERGSGSDAYWWRHELGVAHDPSALIAEANVFRYRPLPALAVRLGHDATAAHLVRVVAAATACGVPVAVSAGAGEPWAALAAVLELDLAVESDDELAARITQVAPVRLRVLGTVADALRTACAAAGVHLEDAPPVASGRIELPRLVREQAVSRTLHRYGNLLGNL